MPKLEGYRHLQPGGLQSAGERESRPLGAVRFPPLLGAGTCFADSGGISSINPTILQRIAATPIEVTPNYGDAPVTYHGSAIPLHGVGRIKTTRERLSAEIDDVEGWEWRTVALRPKGTAVPFGQLFRSTVPGKLVEPEGHGRIVPDNDAWEARDAVFAGQQSHFGKNGNLTTFRFSVSSLDIRGSSHGAEIAATRYVYAGGEWNHSTLFYDRVILVRALSTNAPSIEEETLGVTVEGCPDDVESEAFWLFASFVSGNRLGPLLTEYYAEDGSLISQSHQRGNVSTERHQFFRPFYAPFDAKGMKAGLEGIARRLRDGFPIDVVMNHMFQATTGQVDADAVHLILSAHTAIEAWNRFHGFENWIDGSHWNRFAKHVLNDLIPEGLYESIGSEMRENLGNTLPHANRTTTAWRQARLYEALGIDVTSSAAKRILKMRNELLHNGYFLKSWHSLSLDEAQERRDDVERLRRLALFIVFRLIGYSGQFLDPVNFQTVDMPTQADASVAP